jgi:hypothetical protein
METPITDRMSMEQGKQVLQYLAQTVMNLHKKPVAPDDSDAGEDVADADSDDERGFVIAGTPRPARSTSKPARALTEKEAIKAVDTLAAAVDLPGAVQLTAIITAFAQSPIDPGVASRSNLLSHAPNLQPLARQLFEDYGGLMTYESFPKATKAYRDFMINLARFKVYQSYQHMKRAVNPNDLKHFDPELQQLGRLDDRIGEKADGPGFQRRCHHRDAHRLQ